MNKQLVEKTILLKNIQVSQNFYLARFYAPQISSLAHSGQFVMLESSPKLYLKRPFSFFEVDKNDQMISVYYEVKGLGTYYMSKLWTKNQEVIIQGPLGSQFANWTKYNNIAIVAGGIGVAPMYNLINDFKKADKKYHAIFGARNKDGLEILKYFEDYPQFDLNTDDGSIGCKQNVVQSLQKYLTTNSVDLIITCGPPIMIDKVLEIAKINNIDCQVSYENPMACGTGACMGCTKIINNKSIRVCVEGPVIEHIW